MNAFKKFIYVEISFTAIVSAIALLLFKTVLTAFYLPAFWFLIGIIALLTAAFHYSIIQIQDKGASKFANRFMMVSGIKMMIYLTIITSYSFLFPEKAKIFLITFFILYILYTFFEISLILQYLKRK
jgi:hypothetical protein